MKYTLMTLLACAIFASCGSTIPSASSSTNAHTVGAGFLSQGTGPRHTRYAMTYELKNLDPGSYTAIAYYENIAKPGRPYTSIKRFNVPINRLDMKSPIVSHLRSGYKHTVTLEIRSGGQDGQVVSKHVQKVYFGISPQIAKQLKLSAHVE